MNLTEEITVYKNILNEYSGRVYFSGILCTLDEPSDKSPTGAKGHKIIITKTAAKNALSTLIGAPLNYKSDWNGHDYSVTVGYLATANYPEIIDKIKELPLGTLGMSYEVKNARCINLNQQIWTISEVTFSGAAILKRDKAAYRNTSFRIMEK